MLAVDVSTNHIETMNLPIEALFESIRTCQHIELRHRIQLLMLTVIDPHYLKKHTVRIFIEGSYSLLQSIWRKPVVGIEHTDIFTLRLLQSHISGMCLSLIRLKGYHLYP